MKGALINLKKMREMFWSGRRDLNSGPPAPKPDVLPLGSPSFSISVLKTKELEKYLVVARCTEMWLRMHGVPRIFPIARVGYQEHSETLEIKFERGGMYQFFNVPADVFNGLMNAASKEAYYHSKIGERFPCSR